MNRTEIERLAGAANKLRPDWPWKSLVTFIELHMMDRAYRDVAVALAWVACDPTTKTPKRVLESGPWWQAAVVGEPTSTNIVTRCEHGETGARCPECYPRTPGVGMTDEQRAAIRAAAAAGREHVKALERES